MIICALIFVNEVKVYEKSHLVERGLVKNKGINYNVITSEQMQVIMLGTDVIDKWMISA